jgi:hypothetical protein
MRQRFSREDRDAKSAPALPLEGEGWAVCATWVAPPSQAMTALQSNAAARSTPQPLRPSLPARI